MFLKPGKRMTLNEYSLWITSFSLDFCTTQSDRSRMNLAIFRKKPYCYFYYILCLRRDWDLVSFCVSALSQWQNGIDLYHFLTYKNLKIYPFFPQGQNTVDREEPGFSACTPIAKRAPRSFSSRYYMFKFSWLIQG